MKITLLKFRSSAGRKNILTVGGLRPGDGWTVRQLRDAIQHMPLDANSHVGCTNRGDDAVLSEGRHTVPITNKAIEARQTFIDYVVENDPNVDKGWDEYTDGIWFELKPGLLAKATGTHSVHEWNIDDCKRSLKALEPCTGEEDCGCKEGRA